MFVIKFFMWLSLNIKTKLSRNLVYCCYSPTCMSIPRHSLIKFPVHTFDGNWAQIQSTLKDRIIWGII